MQKLFVMIHVPMETQCFSGGGVVVHVTLEKNLQHVYTPWILLQSLKQRKFISILAIFTTCIHLISLIYSCHQCYAFNSHKTFESGLIPLAQYIATIIIGRKISEVK